MIGEKEDEDDGTLLGQLKAVHRKERKELQSKIMSMKHSIGKNDKKRKKEITTEIATMEEEMKRRHEEELAQLMLSLPEVSVEPVAVEQNHEKKPRITKAQKRREKKAEINRKQSEAALQAEIDAKCARGKLEREAIEQYLIGRDLKIYNIEPDGDCLYSALAHQLQMLTSRRITGADIRKKAATYMRLHKDDFRPFLIGDNGDIVEEIDFEEYCMRVEKSCEDGGVWGGEPELRGAACALERRIEVVQPEGRVLTFGEEYSNSKALVITFHRFAYNLGEHYNSTAPNTVSVFPDGWNEINNELREGTV